MMYPTVFGTSPIMYPPVAMLQPMTVPIQQQVTTRPSPPENKDVEPYKPNASTGYNTTNKSEGHLQRPASQATSVKAEPSTVGSIASASVANKVNRTLVYH